MEFQLATDRRDGLKRATRIALLDDSFMVSGERREQGMVSSVRDCYGFIRCVEREQELFFRFHEILDVDRKAVPGDEVEFTMVPDPTSSFSQNRQNAIRIKYLPPNTVHFETILKEKVSGSVTADVVNYSQRSPTKSQVRNTPSRSKVVSLLLRSSQSMRVTFLLIATVVLNVSARRDVFFFFFSFFLGCCL